MGGAGRTGGEQGTAEQDSAELKAAKAELRRATLERRRAVDPAARGALSQLIADRLLTLDLYRDARAVHLYVGAVDGEVETRAILLDALREGKRVACPRVVADAGGGTTGGGAGRGRRLEHYEVRSLDELVESPRGLWEPDPARAHPIDPAELDLVLVPGIAFDREGHRLGFGAGFYDRFLAGLTIPKVGLAFSLQLPLRVPHSPRDVPVDWIVTENETIPCGAIRESAERNARAPEAEP